jgi:hypothetical protein
MDLHLVGYEDQAALLRVSVQETLRIARCFLSQPGIWTQGAFARDASGRKVKPNSSSACQFDLHGAIAVSCNERAVIPPCILQLLDSIVRDWNMGECATEFNDMRPLELVLALLDTAITRVVLGAPTMPSSEYDLGNWEPQVLKGVG